MPTHLLCVLALVALPVPVADPPGAGAGAGGGRGSDGGGSVAEADAGWSALGSPVSGWSASGFGWPVTGARLVRRFDPPARPWLAGHRGVDLDAPPSATIRAAGAGTILYAGRIAGRGVASVLHADGLRTTYEPVDVDTQLRVGSAVRAGQPLGTLASGHPGCPTSACLHWGLRRGNQYLDPLLLLGLGRVRLLPLGGVVRPN